MCSVELNQSFYKFLQMLNRDNTGSIFGLVYMCLFMMIETLQRDLHFHETFIMKLNFN